MAQSHPILLLQGPLGRFFEGLADAIDARGWVSHRIAFNMGDRCYAHGQYITVYRDKPEAWSNYLAAYIRKHQIACIVLYGDSRFYHQVARQVGTDMAVPVLCLEEGYLRPGYITAEWGGNNANSPLLQSGPLAGEQVHQASIQKAIEDNDVKIPPSMTVENTFRQRAFWGIIYYHMHFYFQKYVKYYRHHRPGAGFGEMVKWVWAGAMKYLVRWSDRIVQQKILHHGKNHQGRVFFCPLQVSVDAQIIHHSDFNSMEDYIEQLVSQFARCSKKTDLLVFKHHPMDRGFKNYKGIITRYARENNIGTRVLYAFDVDAGWFFDHADACITVNSTLGFEAIRRQIPTYVFSTAFYQSAAITPAVMTFEQFISEPKMAVSKRLVALVEQYIKSQALLTGDFYDQRDKTTTNILDKLEEKILR